MQLSFETYAGYFIVAIFWVLSIYREGQIGIGFRFLYGIHLTMFFLVGPVLVDIAELNDEIRYVTDFNSSLQITLAGLFSYVVSAYWISPVFFGQLKIDSSISNSVVRLNSQRKLGWLLCCLGMIAVVLVNQTQQISSFGAVIGQSSNLLDTGVLMLCLHATVTRRYNNVIMVIPLVLLRGTISAALSGHSGQLFIHALVAICLLAFSRKFTFLRLLLVTISSFAILIPATLWLDGRGKLRETLEKNDSGLVERINIFITIFTEPTDINFETLVKQFRNRGDYSEIMAQAVEYTPKMRPYEYGATYLEIIPAVIPRFLWPDKPIKAGGNEFVTQYTGRPFAETTSVEISHMFEFYINFGPVGVFCGLAFMGFLMAYMEYIYQKKAKESLFTEFTLIFINLGIIFYYDRSWLLFMGLLPGLCLCYLLRYAIIQFYPLPNFVKTKPK